MRLSFFCWSFGAYARGNGARKRLGIGPDAPLMVALGRLVEFKGFHVLARAADRILSPHRDAHLVRSVKRLVNRGVRKARSVVVGERYIPHQSLPI